MQNRDLTWHQKLIPHHIYRSIYLIRQFLCLFKKLRRHAAWSDQFKEKLAFSDLSSFFRQTVLQHTIQKLFAFTESWQVSFHCLKHSLCHDQSRIFLQIDIRQMKTILFQRKKYIIA